MWKLLAEVAGVAAFVAGVWLLSVPAALMVAGGITVVAVEVRG